MPCLRGSSLLTPPTELAKFRKCKAFRLSTSVISSAYKNSKFYKVYQYGLQRHRLKGQGSNFALILSIDRVDTNRN